VGWALHSTPAASDVPWHRVVNSRGAISARPVDAWGGLQRALLEDEGIEFDEGGRIDWDRFGWEGLDPAEVRRLMGLVAEGNDR
jgi:methylated-DNA-protein-cysteine methyltransferase-like protein